MDLFLVLVSTHTHTQTHTISRGIFRWENVIKPNRFPLRPLSESILLLSLFLPRPSLAISCVLHHVQQEWKKQANLLFLSHWPLGLHQRLCGSVVTNNFYLPYCFFFLTKKTKQIILSCVLNGFFKVLHILQRDFNLHVITLKGVWMTLCLFQFWLWRRV